MIWLFFPIDTFFASPSSWEKPDMCVYVTKILDVDQDIVSDRRANLRSYSMNEFSHAI